MSKTEILSDYREFKININLWASTSNPKLYKEANSEKESNLANW